MRLKHEEPEPVRTLAGKEEEVGASKMQNTNSRHMEPTKKGLAANITAASPRLLGRESRGAKSDYPETRTHRGEMD